MLQSPYGCSPTDIALRKRTGINCPKSRDVNGIPIPLFTTCREERDIAFEKAKPLTISKLVRTHWFHPPKPPSLFLEVPTVPSLWVPINAFSLTFSTKRNQDLIGFY